MIYQRVVFISVVPIVASLHSGSRINPFYINTRHHPISIYVNIKEFINKYQYNLSVLFTELQWAFHSAGIGCASGRVFGRVLPCQVSLWKNTKSRGCRRTFHSATSCPWSSFASNIRCNMCWGVPHRTLRYLQPFEDSIIEIYYFFHEEHNSRVVQNIM